ncbi:MAG: ParB N-terminal domain-containing protein [Verrucomicrobia bacterium]|nr:ParB N-terminal domain-containing protein [Verrucomicrobiota bacterium]
MNDRKPKKRAASPLEASGPAVNCAFDELVPLEKLVPNQRNPNQHPEVQVRLLAKVIAHQGWRSPVVVSKRSGFIVSGHGRYEAAKVLGLTAVPVGLPRTLLLTPMSGRTWSPTTDWRNWPKPTAGR